MDNPHRAHLPSTVAERQNQAANSLPVARQLDSLAIINQDHLHSQGVKMKCHNKTICESLPIDMDKAPTLTPTHTHTHTHTDRLEWQTLATISFCQRAWQTDYINASIILPEHRVRDKKSRQCQPSQRTDGKINDLHREKDGIHNIYTHIDTSVKTHNFALLSTDKQVFIFRFRKQLPMGIRLPFKQIERVPKCYIWYLCSVYVVNQLLVCHRHTDRRLYICMRDIQTTVCVNDESLYELWPHFRSDCSGRDTCKAVTTLIKSGTAKQMHAINLQFSRHAAIVRSVWLSAAGCWLPSESNSESMSWWALRLCSSQQLMPWTCDKYTLVHTESFRQVKSQFNLHGGVFVLHVPHTYVAYMHTYLCARVCVRDGKQQLGLRSARWCARTFDFPAVEHLV